VTAKERTEQAVKQSFESILDQALATILTRSLVDAYAATSQKSPNALRGDLTTTSEVLKALKEKRDIGAMKYGEHSFQRSVENFVACDLPHHLLEELLDAVNYAASLVYRDALLGDIPSAAYASHVAILSSLLYPLLQSMEFLTPSNQGA